MGSRELGVKRFLKEKANSPRTAVVLNETPADRRISLSKTHSSQPHLNIQREVRQQYSGKTLVFNHAEPWYQESNKSLRKTVRIILIKNAANVLMT